MLLLLLCHECEVQFIIVIQIVTLAVALLAMPGMGLPGYALACACGRGLGLALHITLWRARLKLRLRSADWWRLVRAPLAMPNIATWWCGDPAARAAVRASPRRMVLADALTTRLPFDPKDDLTRAVGLPADVLARRLAEGGGDLVAHCLGKAAGAERAVGAVGFGFGAHAGQVAVLARGGHFFGLHGQDFLQDVGHIRL